MARSGRAHAHGGGMTLEAVVFDVDFTIAKPGPDLGPRGLQDARRSASASTSTPALYERARRDAIATLKRHPELDHDEEVWVLFTERIIEGMGGVGDTYACALEMTRAWERADHFELFEERCRCSRSCAGTASGSACSRTPAATSTRSSLTTGSTSTRSSPRGCTARPSRTRRSFARCSSGSACRPSARRWSATTRPTTSTARVRSACARGSSIATIDFRNSRSGCATCRELPAALGLVRQCR